MHSASVNRSSVKVYGSPRLFLVPTGATARDLAPLPSRTPRRPFIAKENFAFSRRNILTASLCLTVFWTAHLLLVRVFHI